MTPRPLRAALSLTVLAVLLPLDAGGREETREARNGEEIAVLPPAEIVDSQVLAAMDEDWWFFVPADGAPPDWPLTRVPADAPPVDELLAPDEPTTDRVVPIDAAELPDRWWSGASAPFSAWDEARQRAVTPKREKDARARRKKGNPPARRTALVWPAAGEGTDRDDEGPRTLYLVRAFQVEDPDSLVSLQLEAKFAGGAVVYLNGEELARYNVEYGEEGVDQLASPFLLPDPVNQTTYGHWRRTWIGLDPAALVAGENVLAVQVHRRPDAPNLPLYLDLRLDGYAEAGLVRSPFLQAATPESITVAWDTSVPAYGHLEYGQPRSRTRQIVRTGSLATTHHEAVIDGLEPDTEYGYQVFVHPVPSGDDGPLAPRFASRERTFRTALEDPEEPFTFLAYGDSRTQEGIHEQLIELMWEEVQLADARFVVNTGDIVTHGSPWHEWQDEFFGPTLPLMGYVPFFVALGNHELNHESWYDQLALPENESWYTFSYGDVDFFALNTNTKFVPRSEQHDWFVEALEASEARWKVVFFHHPPYSCTPSRKPGDRRVRKHLIPLLEEYDVDLVLLGHDHLYGRSRDVEGVRYVITGGGGAWTYPAVPDAVNEVCVREYHYCRIDVTPESFELVAVDIEGEEIDRFVLEKPLDPYQD